MKVKCDNGMHDLQGTSHENLRITCFPDSMMQCLTYTEPLATYLQSDKHQISCK